MALLTGTCVAQSAWTKEQIKGMKMLLKESGQCTFTDISFIGQNNNHIATAGSFSKECPLSSTSTS